MKMGLTSPEEGGETLMQLLDWKLLETEEKKMKLMQEKEKNQTDPLFKHG